MNLTQLPWKYDDSSPKLPNPFSGEMWIVWEEALPCLPPYLAGGPLKQHGHSAAHPSYWKREPHTASYFSWWSKQSLIRHYPSQPLLWGWLEILPRRVHPLPMGSHPHQTCSRNDRLFPKFSIVWSETQAQKHFPLMHREHCIRVNTSDASTTLFPDHFPAHHQARAAMLTREGVC